MTAREELTGALQWLLDISADNAAYLTQLILNAEAEEMLEQARKIVDTHTY